MLQSVHVFAKQAAADNLHTPAHLSQHASSTNCTQCLLPLRHSQHKVHNDARQGAIYFPPILHSPAPCCSQATAALPLLEPQAVHALDGLGVPSSLCYTSRLQVATPNARTSSTSTSTTQSNSNQIQFSKPTDTHRPPAAHERRLHHHSLRRRQPHIDNASQAQRCICCCSSICCSR